MKTVFVVAVLALVACGHPHGLGDDTHDGGHDSNGADDASGGDGGNVDDAGGHGDGNHGQDGGGGGQDGGGGGQDGGGGGGPCSSTPICAHALSNGVGSIALAVGVDAQRNVYVAGLSEGDLVFGGHTLYRIGYRDVFVVSFTGDGSYRWAKRFGYSGSQTLGGAYAIAIDAASNIYITGGMLGTIDFGGGYLSSHGLFVASFDTNGNYRWARADGGGMGALGIAQSGTHVYAIGRFYNTMTLSPTIAVTSAGDADVFVAAFDTATGAALWARSRGGPATDVEGGIAARPDWIAFSMSTASVGSGETLVSYTADGADRWVKPLPPAIDLRGVNADPSGNIYVTGLHGYGADVPPGAPTIDGNNEFVHSYDSTGTSRWSWTLPESPAHSWTAIPVTPSAFDPAGHLVLAGTYDGTLYAGGAPLAPGLESIFLASFDTSSTPLGARKIDDAASTSYEWVHGVAIDSIGRAYVVGEYYGMPNFGDGALPFASEGGLLILSLAP